ncbi:MAG: phosphatase PAP2 family protein [Candidatus Aenigmatarchaeota archaeon]
MIGNPWYIITLIGDPYIWTVLIGVFIFFFLISLDTVFKNQKLQKRKKNFKKFVIVLVASLLIAYIAVGGIKAITEIPRPCTPCLTETISACNPFCTEDYSFPSGHSTIAFVIFTSVILASRRKKLIPLFIIPALVAASRVILGVHTISDVVAGSALGFLITFFIWKHVKKRQK